jgi:predicted RNA-binding protein associated with RNAse of E/G family
MSQIAVVKLDENGNEKLTYMGEVVARGETWVYLQAPFQIESVEVGPVTLRRGDVFHEWFYTNRWYNIFRIHDSATGMLKAYYCNVTRPAQLTDIEVRSEDLALDLLITPAGKIHMLDEDEFEALTLSAEERDRALQAVEQLRQLVAGRTAPFDLLPH